MTDDRNQQPDLRPKEVEQTLSSNLSGMPVKIY